MAYDLAKTVGRVYRYSGGFLSHPIREEMLPVHSTSPKGRHLIASLSLAIILVLLLLLQAIQVQTSPVDSKLAQQVVKVAPEQTYSIRGSVQRQQQHQDRSTLLSQHRNETSPKMHNQSHKRSTGNGLTTRPPKRFRTADSEFHLQRLDSNSSFSMINIDLNNNSTAASMTRKSSNSEQEASDLNNNLIPSAGRELGARPNINSVNGSIDLSEYSQTDLDRLYGDALLVYLKNFNETLPARRETIRINGTTNQVPIYKSETRTGRWD